MYYVCLLEVSPRLREKGSTVLFSFKFFSVDDNEM